MGEVAVVVIEAAATSVMLALTSPSDVVSFSQALTCNQAFFHSAFFVTPTFFHFGNAAIFFVGCMPAFPYIYLRLNPIPGFIDG
jgi:hypothetical protein